MASKTCDAITLPTMQADPLDAQTSCSFMNLKVTRIRKHSYVLIEFGCGIQLGIPFTNNLHDNV